MQEGWVELDDLIGAGEIAELFGFTHTQTVHTLRRRHADFPQPVKQLRQGYIWSRKAVQRWGRSTGRLPKDATG